MLEAGTVLQGRYRVISPLGQGGMGAVYYAWDMRLSIPVALKEMLAQTGLAVETLDELRVQFQQEAKVLARLNHPNLVAVTDFFEENTNAYLVMKYVEGESLADRIRRTGSLPEDEVLAIAQQLLDGLAYCHSQGVIHRDIKPANIIIRPDGQVVLVDFGLVKLWDPHDPQTQTAIRGVGTPQYAPPEQYETADGHTGPRSDLYSVGATLYYALTGQAPPTATLRIASPEAFAPIRTSAPNVSNRTADAVERAVELVRANRWSDALTMAQALGLSIRAWGQATPGLDPGREAETVRMPDASVNAAGERKRFPLWILGIAGIVILGSGIVASLMITGVLALPGGAASTPPPTQVDAPATATPFPTASPTSSLTPLATLEPTTTTAVRLKATETSTPFPKPSATPSLTPTDTPTLAVDTPTFTATPSETTEATPTPEPPALSPTSEPVVTGALIGFETWGTWRRGDQPYGELVQTQEQVKGGAYAAKLVYDFPSSGEDYVVFVQPRAISGQPNRFAAWVYGDGSGHFVNLWIQDAESEIWSVNLGTVGSAGWQRLTGSLTPGLDWPNGRLSGPDNGLIDYPVTFYALVLDRPGAGALQGEIVLDEIEAWRGEVPSDGSDSDDTEDPSTGDNSVDPAEVGRILYTVEFGETYALYSTDPTWDAGFNLGSTTWEQSTCASSLTASTVDGTAFNLQRQTACGLTERTDTCPSPNGSYKLVTNFLEGWKYDVLLQSTADGANEWYYQGSLNTDFGVRWAANSRVVAFGIGSTVNVIQVGGGGYQQVVSAYDDRWPPRLSPDGGWIVYLQPGGGETDILVSSVPDGETQNLTHDLTMIKLCPRWLRP